MKSLKGHDISDDRTVIDIKDTAEKHQELSKYILQLHALTGADCIPALFKVDKKRALNSLEPRGHFCKQPLRPSLFWLFSKNYSWHINIQNV